MDDFQIGADTVAAGINHITLRLSSSGKAISLQRAEQDYLSSYMVWAQKFARDRNIIEQQFSNTPFSVETSGVLTNVQGGFEAIDYCLQYHIALATLSDDYKPQPTECKLVDGTSINVPTLLTNLRVCTHAMTVTLRPDPRFDFATEDAARALLNVKMAFLRQYCQAKNISAITGVPVSGAGQKPST
ncbi:hypothetical protein [Burkholderia territorii]|uniref:hypothetical protein n=1 Tax=Burkholderia territorii TaxID=1503055 RepID=UPI0012DA7A40|nr:hypothetical protein [Burkholderia territorii]